VHGMEITPLLLICIHFEEECPLFSKLYNHVN
jgi:hypothetical protein